MAPPVHGRSESFSKGGWEPTPRRGYLRLSLKNTVFGTFLLCSCVFLLVNDVQYAPLVLRVFREDEASAELPGVVGAEQESSLMHPNATDQVLEEKFNQESEVGNLQNSTSEADDALADIDLSEEENLTVEEELGEDSNSTTTRDESPSASDYSDAPVTSTMSENQTTTETVEASPNAGIQDWDIPRAIPKTWKPPRRCATAEEMGQETEGDTRAASLRVRAMIQEWIAEHGAKRVIAGAGFCERGFVLGNAMEDGFGNNMYKVLTAAGLAVMLNRSFIIAERGGTTPTYARRNPQRKPAFGDYLDFSDEAFTVREVRRLWAVHECATKHRRALLVHTDSLEKGFRRTRCTCDDWTTLTVPILHFRGAIGSGAIQLLLKNAHPAMRRAAAKLLGNPGVPSSRPNTFGELFRAFVAPNADIRNAVQWALKGGPDPDIALHLRMLHSRTRPAPAAASSCINRIRKTLNSKLSGRRPRVVVVTDTPAIIPQLQKALGQSMEVVRFDYQAYAKQSTNRSEVLGLNYGVPKTTLRLRDWGEMPRWVAMVDFFLAARARSAVVSGAYRRVSTTYAQFVAALANANTLDSHSPCVYYSSFQSNLLGAGLATQSGWGHSWRPFGGKLGCRNQAPQCARTALLPYTWWDAPWQSPIGSDVSKLKGVAGIDALGQVSEHRMDQFCAQARRRGPLPTFKLQVPSYDDAIAEGAS